MWLETCFVYPRELGGSGGVRQEDIDIELVVVSCDLVEFVL
jgi:hypothetical protein